jgi:hypothetical protein
MFLVNIRIGRNSYVPHGLLGIASPANKQSTYPTEYNTIILRGFYFGVRWGIAS